jgi:hypothetical protein
MRLKLILKAIPSILILAFAMGISAQLPANRNWSGWSKAECENLLLESPWAHTWRFRAQPSDPLLGHQTIDQLVFSVQLRSSLPIRNAIVRLLQLAQKYEKMNDTERNAFDTKAIPILNRDYDDLILVHVDFAQSNGSDNLHRAVHNEISAGDLDASLITGDGIHIKPTRVDMSEKMTHAFDLIFPRTKDGAPLITDRQKQFTVEFQSPQILYFEGIHIPSMRVRADFDPSKMALDGKLNY